jgi:hypothetical protein
VRLHDLPPRQRETVLRLWEGACPKDVATGMGISLAVVRQYSCTVAKKLPGSGSPLQKIALWRARLILDALPDPIKDGLKPLLGWPEVASHTWPPATPRSLAMK